jgi:hypothetical protein
MIGMIFWKHVGFRRLDRTPVLRNDAHGDLVEDTLGRYPAQRPHFVPWVISKPFEQGEGFLLGFEWREEAGSGHVADPNGTSKSNSKSRFDECLTAGVGAIEI